MPDHQQISESFSQQYCILASLPLKQSISCYGRAQIDMFNELVGNFLVVFEKALRGEVPPDTDDWTLSLLSLRQDFKGCLLCDLAARDILYIEIGEGASSVDVEGKSRVLSYLHIELLDKWYR